MSSVQPISFVTSYPSWLYTSVDSNYSSRLDSPMEPVKSSRDNYIHAPQPQRLSSLLQNPNIMSSLSVAPKANKRRLSSPQSDASWSSFSSTPSLTESVSTSASLSHKGRALSRLAPTKTGRVSVPLLFSDDQIVQRVDFSSCYRRGVSLADWARLAEKRKTYLALNDARERLDELFCDDERVLLQSHWPGYASRTSFLEFPSRTSEIEKGLTKGDLLDMVCSDLLQWMLTLTNGRHIVCCDPRWAVGLDQITFRHIFVVGVVQVRGYVPKWVPVLEVDRSAFAA